MSVSIRTISAIKLHPNADLLEIAQVDGWVVAVKKGVFHEGDEAVYFSIDSILPVKPEYEFLRKKCYVPDVGHRLKTCKVRGELSQGILMPFSQEIKLDIENQGLDWRALDLSAFFEVTRYGGIPTYTMVQDVPKVQLITTPVEAVQKYCGHNVRLSTRKYSSGWMRKLLGVKTIELEHMSASCPRTLENAVLELSKYLNAGIAVSATVCGPNIQGNYHSLLKDAVIITNITMEGEQLSTQERRELVVVMQDRFGFKGRHALIQIPSGKVMPLANIPLLLQLSSYSLPNSKPNVGLEWRTTDGSLSFVTMNNQYLLRENNGK